MESKIVLKGWGFEKHIVNKPEYCGKLLHFEKGKKCSYHFHRLKDETFYLQSGELKIKFGLDDDLENANEITLKAGDSFHVYIGMRHQMIAVKDSDLFEFSTQDFPEDSIRVAPGDSQKESK